MLRVGRGEGYVRRVEQFAVKKPLGIRLNSEADLVTMRTYRGTTLTWCKDLCGGASSAERSDVMLARYCAGSGADGVNGCGVLDVTLRRRSRRRVAVQRNVMTTSACGICGISSIEPVLREPPYEMEHEVQVTRRTGYLGTDPAPTSGGEPSVAPAG